jgi:hypothetical protein
MSISIKVIENGRIEVVDFDGERWTEHGSVREAMVVTSRILRRQLKARLKELETKYLNN